MLDDAHRHAEVATAADGTVRVRLAPDHPGAADGPYLARRAEIARCALAWDGTFPPPEIDYTAQEQEIWRQVSRALYAHHTHGACSAYLEGWEAAAFRTGRVPQLHEVSATLEPVSGFCFVPQAGYVPAREYLGALADGTLHVTQHLRHPHRLLNAPETDVVHDLLGHAVMLANPLLAQLHRRFGHAARRLQSQPAIDLLERVFVATCERGVVMEDGVVRSCGAELLSCPGWQDATPRAAVRPLEFAAIASGRRGVLYLADSAADLEAAVADFLETMDDDTPARLAAG